MTNTRGTRGRAALVPAAILMMLAAAIAAPAQTFTTLGSFDSKDGTFPITGLIQATNGNLYGTTYRGGPSACSLGCGTIFEISTSGTLTTLQSFDGSDGAYPLGPVQATDGNFYGTTFVGGASSTCQNEADTGCGTVFKVTSGGTLTMLQSFGGTDGAFPYAGLVQATDGSFYGTTGGGGVNFSGTVFKITPSGTVTALHSFDYTDGSAPLAGLVQATNGNLYGTTEGGGANGYGTVFEITPGGALTTLYSFCSQSGCADGEGSETALIQATDGNLYGTALFGGTYGGGTIFKITLGGVLTTLYSFCPQSGCTDGEFPEAALIQATDGDFYGTTANGGAYGSGTIFKISPAGVLTTLYSFCSQNGCTDGSEPVAALVQYTNGTLYGTTSGGGSNSDGTIFSLSVGLGPFVETQTTSGKVGAAVKILGTNLTGASSVTFNGTAATFTVVSPSLITTTVPTGATTGKVEVVTPSGTLTSNVQFRVLP